MKKLLLLLCIFCGVIYSTSAQTLKINVAASTLFPGYCDSDQQVTLSFSVKYTGGTISTPEKIVIKYRLAGTSYTFPDSVTEATLANDDSVLLTDTNFDINAPNGFSSHTEDIIVIWPTGSGGLAVPGDTIIDSTHVVTTGIPSINNSFGIAISPNPAENFLYLNYNSTTIHLEQVRIYNLLGQTVLLNTLPVNLIDISSLPEGFYYLEATDANNSRYVAPFIKTH